MSGIPRLGFQERIQFVKPFLAPWKRQHCNGGRDINKLRLVPILLGSDA